MADSQEELQAEYEQFEQAEASLISGDEAAPAGGMRPWVKWVILADLVIIAVVLAIVFAT